MRLPKLRSFLLLENTAWIVAISPQRSMRLVIQ